MKDLVDRFLSWPLPKSVCSDGCVTMLDYPNRSGTNLLTASEAEEMLKYVVEPILKERDRYREALERIVAVDQNEFLYPQGPAIAKEALK